MSFSIRTSNKLAATHTSAAAASASKQNTDFLSSDDYSFLDSNKKNVSKSEKPKVGGASIHQTKYGGGINPDYY